LADFLPWPGLLGRFGPGWRDVGPLWRSTGLRAGLRLIGIRVGGTVFFGCLGGQKKAQQRRGTSTERGYDVVWRRIRAMVLADEPLCRECLKKGLVEAAREVDHIIPIKQAPQLRLVHENLQGFASRAIPRRRRVRRAGRG
jgi:hypothetical protein